MIRVTAGEIASLLSRTGLHTFLACAHTEHAIFTDQLISGPAERQASKLQIPEHAAEVIAKFCMGPVHSTNKS